MTTDISHPDATPDDEPRRRAPIPQERALTRAEGNYQTIVNALKADRGADAKAIRAMLGGDKRLMDRFLSTTFALLASNPKVLEDATPASLIQAIKDAASLGLEPMTQDGGIVVYDHVATFLPSWQGHLKRIRNSGRVQDVDVQLVYENDGFEYGWTERGGWFKHAPAKTDRGGYWGAYAYAVMPSGFVELEVMTEADINAVRDRYGRTHSKTGKPLPWVTAWGEMARKTVIRRLRKRLPQSPVDMLLDREPEIDASVIDAQVQPVRDELASVREMALRAVQGLPEGPRDGEAAEEA